MARRKKSLDTWGEGYCHREHRSAASRKRRLSVLLRERIKNGEIIEKFTKF